ncbi:hypothetical protein DFH08DRAFT_934080 [Mycena albidolilacea]|uniref:DUF7918 domain-containing protein n=1 Tax=Mycena albidolilacea TaxID=1033008 RepID=A0AAD7ACA0_9AGAR|nr:hypothetical protein DFH08DRAFT_934080 [Mycena albidolilacea]
MVNYGGISCWVEIENSAAPEYHIETFDDHKLVTCWIASEVGKKFSVSWRNSFLPAPTAGHVFMDGIECGGRVIWGPGPMRATHEGVTDTRTVKSFVFSPLTVTDDDDFLQDSPNRKLGCIEVAIYPIQIFGFVPAVSNSSTLSEIKIHERSKKSNAVAHRFTGPPLVTFVFKYRPLDTLRANGVMPSPPQLKIKPALELPLEPHSDDEQSDAEEIRILREKLDALEAKRAKKSKKARVKEEEENIPPSAGPSRKKAKLNGN